MNLRTAAASAALWLLFLPGLRAQQISAVVGVHRSPGDLRSICVTEDRLFATTAGGESWSVTIADLTEAILGPSVILTPTWMPPQSGGAPRCRKAAAPDRQAEIDGFPVTATARLAGELYTATFGGGLYRSTRCLVASSPPEIHDLAVIDGHLLMAHTGGLTVFDGTTVTSIRLGGPPVADITALAWMDDTLWAGSFDNGLVVYRMGRWDTVPTIPKHGGDWINALCWDGATLWVGSNAGLGRWDPSSGAVVHETEIDERVQSIRCSDGELVVATEAAIWIGNGHDWRRIDLAGEALHTATRHRGELWAAGLRGIMRNNSGNWRRDTELNGRLPDSWITALLPDGDSMWAGSYDAGLLRTDRNGAWKTVVASAWVNPNAMALTSKGVAVGTMGDGLLLSDSVSGQWRRLMSTSGLPSDDVTALTTTGDTLWVGTRAGIAEVRWLDRPELTRHRRRR